MMYLLPHVYDDDFQLRCHKSSLHRWPNERFGKQDSDNLSPPISSAFGQIIPDRDIYESISDSSQSTTQSPDTARQRKIIVRQARSAHRAAKVDEATLECRDPQVSLAINIHYDYTVQWSCHCNNHSSFRVTGMDGREGKPGARGPKGEVG